ncbi:MAG TPA: glucose-1-phosphate cytidylyltransferase [Caproicibacter sp.]|nr:glucose-1-phosphate cytidylyltransferase [Caproicibacter sp.]
MKTVILAGGFGTRISEESYLRPKPMIEIGGQPILWHIMKLYSHYGYNDFIICLGYKGYVIKEYFADYFLHTSDVTFDLANNKMFVHSNHSEPWKVTLIDTGLNTMTGGRVKRIQPYVGNEPFMLTYGDGVSNVNIDELVKFHRNHGKMATLTAIQPEGRFGIMDLNENQIRAFREKSKDDTGWVNAGFMILQPEFFNYINDDGTILEKEPLESISKKGQIMAYKHSGFWQCMDTQRDKKKLEDMWNEGKAPWKVWAD